MAIGNKSFIKVKANEIKFNNITLEDIFIEKDIPSKYHNIYLQFDSEV